MEVVTAHLGTTWLEARDGGERLLPPRLPARSRAERGPPSRGALLVTHRVGTLATADEIVVLEGGRVVQRGRHGTLVAAPGTYAKLYA